MITIISATNRKDSLTVKVAGFYSKLLSQQPQVDPITNLTGTETAVLSPTEKVIAGRT